MISRCSCTSGMGLDICGPVMEDHPAVFTDSLRASQII